jgi:hypothetical protein
MFWFQIYERVLLKLISIRREQIHARGREGGKAKDLRPFHLLNEQMQVYMKNVYGKRGEGFSPKSSTVYKYWTCNRRSVYKIMAESRKSNHAFVTVHWLILPQFPRDPCIQLHLTFLSVRIPLRVLNYILSPNMLVLINYLFQISVSSSCCFWNY